ncbi:MAG: hypothetical protein QOE06_3612 [Thermoleophilaceae bacterium]|jgi:uncharacterized membrane protein YeaQ/YmgE (transglycosylase-associated protein family)|nr:hypothetical protein [Thermoleophilaceae bacterium]
MIGFIIMLAISGLVVGALARLALPGRDPMSLFQTMLVGIAGSLIAGLIFYAITKDRNAVGLIPSVLVTTGLVYAIRRSRGGTLTKPAPRDGRPLTR